MEVDAFMLADGAQAVQGKIYIVGGGWDRLTVADLPTAHGAALAIRAQVEWNETNTKHVFHVEIQDADRNIAQNVADGEFEIGTPPGISRGAVQPFMLAVNFAIVVDRFADYTIVLSIDNEEKARYPFGVVKRVQAGA